MRLLDLCCGAGGAAMGYHRAGFDEIVGVDIAAQPRYPFEFVQGDALEFLVDHGHVFDAVHASPPCQGYSVMHNLPWLRGREYPLLILPMIETLEMVGKPYVLENVMGARAGATGLKKRGLEEHGLRAGWLCGASMGLPFYRHRLFAANWLWLAPPHRTHTSLCSTVTVPVGDSLTPGQHDGLSRWQKTGRPLGTGHSAGWRLAAEAMGIDWMKRAELTQAIPPAYTEFIGRQLRRMVHE